MNGNETNLLDADNTDIFGSFNEITDNDIFNIDSNYLNEDSNIVENSPNNIDDSLPYHENFLLFSESLISSSPLKQTKEIHRTKQYQEANKPNQFNFYKTNAGIWMEKIFGKKIPRKGQLLKILKSLQIPWNDNHETQYLWKKVKNSDKLSYRDIYRNKNILLEYLSRVWENKKYQKYLVISLLELAQDFKSNPNK